MIPLDSSTDDEITSQKESIFLQHTLYLFSWDECVALVKGTNTKYTIELTLEEALELIDDGWTAVPF